MEQLTELQHKVWLDRYCLKDSSGQPIEKNIEETWRRVAKAVSVNEKDRGQWEKEFYRVLKGFKFVPAGRQLAGLGTGTNVTYNNCYLLPMPHDSRHGILDNLREFIECMSRGGGVGVNYSTLRPKGSYIRSVNGYSSGPSVWMELYSVATGKVIQMGGTRRGAYLACLYDWHPDIEEFITRKSTFVTLENGIKTPEFLQHCNISVGISDAFMNAVRNDLDWDLVFPEIDYPAYDKEWDGDINEWKRKGYPVKTYKTVRAKDLWNLIVTSAWKSADPGLLFIDRANQVSNSWYCEKQIGSNPCGEIIMGAYNVCLLGAMNLSKYVIDGSFDARSFHDDVGVAVRFLDNVIDIENYPLPQILDTQKNGLRRMGLGIMGLADAFIKMKVRYGSDESVELTQTIFSALKYASYMASSNLAVERGSFGLFDAEKFLQGEQIQRLPKTLKEDIASKGMRNCFVNCVAPTGSTGLLANTSSGIEPVFDFVMRRVDRIGEHIIYHPLAEEWLKDNMGRELPDYFVNASQVTPEEHVRIQSTAQYFIDQSISKTTNLPNSATVEDVSNSYLLADELGLKGFTVYREDSRDAVLYKIKDESKPEIKEFIRPEKLSGDTHKIQTPVGTAWITVTKNEDGRPVELFCQIGKAGSDVTADAEALGRLVSHTFKTTMHLPQNQVIEDLVDQLAGIGGSSSTGMGKKKVRSVPDAIAKVLKSYLTTKEEHAIIEKEVSIKTNQRDVCPQCGNVSLVHAEGCEICMECGFSKC